MSQDFHKITLGDLTTFQRGFDITKAEQEEGPFPVISSSGPKSNHSAFKVEGPGVVIGRKGSLGTVYYVEGKFWPHDTTLWVKDFHGNDPKFCYYFLQTLHLEQYDVGASNPTLNRNHIHGLPIFIPPVPKQRRIASILSTYDDLIENNTRRIAILEEMARRLYEEWFVHFRFPGHEDASFVESEIGKIPEEWDLKTVNDVFEIVGGGTPSKKINEYWENGTINWYSPTDLTREKSAFMDASGVQITDLGLKKSSAKLFPPMSVMMTSRATIGVISINTTEASTNQGFITCLPNQEFPLYVMYHWLKNNVETFINLGTGATFKEITKGTFKTIPIIVPPHFLTKSFQEKVTPFMELALNLQRKNANLHAQRDLLLPKLVSGEIDVSEAEKSLEGAVA